MNFRKIMLRCAAVLLLSVLTACATPQLLSGHALHNFSFDASRESTGTVVLFYRYGSANEYGLQTEQEDLPQGKSRQGVSVTGDMPVGKDLYVKWRDEATGKVYEETVDLKSRLPFSMDKQQLHFIIEGAQLFVYVISYEPVRDVMSSEEAARIRSTHKTLRQKVFSFKLRNRVIQIYPTKLIDPHLPSQFQK